MAHEIYLKLDSILGECNEIYHKHWIVLDSFSCSISSADSDGNASGGCDHSPLEVSKHIDRSSPKLAIAACNLHKFNCGTIHICNQNATSQLNSIVLECVIRGVKCISYSLNGEDTSTDSLSLSYDSIEWHYMYLDPLSHNGRGRTVTKWDTSTNSST